MRIGNNNQLKRIKKLLVFFISIVILFSCGQTNIKKNTIDKNQFEATALEIDISNKNCLAILLAKDGTINRKGSGIADSANTDFFIGITKEKTFALMETVSNDLLSYCGQNLLDCDTTKQTYKVTISFSDSTSDYGFEYCINGTLNNLPEPIRKYITNAIKITDPWYQTQKSFTDKK